jgi:hypothetical protein
MFITAYMVISDPNLYRVSVDETIESLYDHVDAFAILDVSTYEYFDPSRYGKIRKYVKGMLNPFDNPMGGLLTTAYRLVDSDHAMVIEGNEIFDFKNNLKDIVRSKKLDLSGGGAAFYYRNYYGNRCLLYPAMETKGAQLFQTHENYIHYLMPDTWEHNEFKRYSKEPGSQSGVSILDRQSGQVLGSYPPLPREEVVVHNVSMLDLAAYKLREFISMHYLGIIDLKKYYGFTYKLELEDLKSLYAVLQQEVDKGKFVNDVDTDLWVLTPNDLVDQYVTKYNITEIPLPI